MEADLEAACKARTTQSDLPDGVFAFPYQPAAMRRRREELGE